MLKAVVLTTLVMVAATGHADDVSPLLPSGHEIIASADGTAWGRPYRVVALKRQDEADIQARTGHAPPRPVLVVFLDRHGAPTLAGRNDHVALRADEGGQCDPFDDGYDPLVVTGPSFTVQNGVACGQHWTDFVTFRFDPRRHGFLFRSEIGHSWRMNPSDAPGAEALIEESPALRLADPAHPVAFSEFRRR